MPYRKKKSSFKFYGTFSLLVILGLLIFANHWITSIVDNLLVRTIVSRKVESFRKMDEENRRRMYKGDVVRKVLMNPNRTYAESRIYVKDEMVAQFNTINGDEIVDLRGVLPEGNVNFVNETKETYGEERFHKGKRHGLYKEYYSNGILYRQAKFHKGKLMKNAIYYFDETPRRIEDFTDALRFVDEREIGFGRIYYRDGTIMYEWKLTNLLKGGYKKSFNQKGVLVEEKVYDNAGDLVEVINYGYRKEDSRFNNN